MPPRSPGSLSKGIQENQGEAIVVCFFLRKNWDLLLRRSTFNRSTFKEVMIITDSNIRQCDGLTGSPGKSKKEGLGSRVAHDQSMTFLSSPRPFIFHTDMRMSQKESDNDRGLCFHPRNHLSMHYSITLCWGLDKTLLRLYMALRDEAL
jgi:hypothetical protein